MKYINLENFRYITGHGKQVAVALDEAIGLCGWPNHNNVGELVVVFRPRDGAWSWHFSPPYENTQDPNNSRVATIMIVAEDLSFGSLLNVTSAYLPLLLTELDLTNFYQLYGHQFFEPDGTSPHAYIGITKRHWKVRWAEHLRSARNGSHYKFHQMIAERPTGACRHFVMGLVKTEAEAMAAEEKAVWSTLYPKGLNMIPGGYAGIRFLHRIGAVRRGERVSPDEKHEFINRFFETESRSGRPNPFASANWLNDEYAMKVICGAPNRLNPAQIRDARFLEDAGMPLDKIVTEVGARNAAQVRRLLGGSTYSRIH